MPASLPPLNRAFHENFLGELRSLGVNHVALNLKYGRRPAGDVLEEMGRDVLPQFTAATTAMSVA